MYVVPHWSFELAEERVLIRHSITGALLSLSPLSLDLLESLYLGETAGLELAGLVSVLQEARLVFSDEQAAEAWLREHEAATTRVHPDIDQIELTNRCPYTCEMCPRTSSMSRGLGDMSDEVFDLALAAIPNSQKYVGLHHFGESLLHQGLPRFISRARSRGVATGLSCNPPSLKPHIADRILAAGVSQLVLSLDSLVATTYRQIRGPAADIEKARHNIAELVRLRDQTGAETHITLQLITMAANKAEADEFLQYCKDSGVDRGVIVHLGRWDFSDDKVRTLGGSDAPGYGAPCDRPQTSVVVLWDGRVVACCHDYNGDVVLGNLRNQTMAEIWNSPPATKFREAWNETPLCRSCAFSRWYAETRRRKVGFRAFHRSQRNTEKVQEFTRVTAARAQFDGFDIVGRR